KLRQAFPMNFAEAYNAAYTHPTFGAVPVSPLPALQAYTTYLSNMGVTSATVRSPSYLPQPYASSACLPMALQRGVSGAGIDPSNLTSGGAMGHAGSLPYLTDAWGKPIYFSRFPVGSTILNPSGGPLAGANDPGDPQGYLLMASWGTTYGP